MTVDTDITEAERLTHVTLNGTVNRGDPIAHNGTGWVQADASDAATNLYAQYIALSGGVSGDIIQACKGCTLYDADAPFTANTVLYLSATAGAITHTRPTEAAAVIQVLGRSVDTYRARLDIKEPFAYEVFYPPSVFDSTNEPGLGVIDSPVWVGQAIDTAGEDIYYQGRIPSNAIALEAGRAIWNSVGESTGTVSGAIIVAADGATNTGDTGTALTAAVPTSCADNKLCYSDVTACFDADAFKAGYNFNIILTQTASAAGDLQAIGLYMRYTVV